MAQDTVNYEELDEDIEFRYYRFNFYYTYPKQKEPENITPYTRFIYIENDYEEQKFPVMKVKLNLPKKIFLDMFKNQEEMIFFIKIKRYKQNSSKLTRDATVTAKIEEEQVDELEYLDGVLLKPLGKPFKQIDQDDDKGNLEEGGDDSNVLDGNDGNMEDYIPAKEVEFYLFKREHLLYNKLMNSYVFTDTNLATVVLYLIQRNTTYRENDIYVGKFDNTKKYEQIIIPPLNFFDALNYLQRVYGLYNNGLQIFADFKHLFIEDKCKVVKIDQRKKGVSKAIVEFYSDKDKDKDYTAKNLQWFSKKKNCFMIRSTIRPVVENKSNELQELTGEKTTIYATNTKKHFTENYVDMRYGNKANGDIMKESFYWNPYSHAMFESEFIINNNRDMFNLKTNFVNSCLESFILNREYHITDYAKKVDLNINGIYKIVFSGTLITNLGGSSMEPMDMRVSHNIVFKKIDKAN